ncbi:hypothetical protein [Escherichia coli]|uniref:hypothetical protein n=1 Tax=Escherichia coli TaxID=562 RepID=UPI00358F97C5
MIEIPYGANFFVDNGNDGIFFKAMDSHDTWSIDREDKEWKHGAVKMREYMDAFSECKIVWQRKDDSVVEGEVFKGEKKHSHYFKDVSHLEYVDVYRVLDLFEVVDPCIQHSIKKLLCAGMRGAKNQPQDIQEAIDSLVRYQEMRKEDRK